jgi:hypothetical protein
MFRVTSGARRGRLLRVTTTLALAAGAVTANLAIGGTPASAALSGISLESSAWSVSDSSPSKTMYVDCPANTTVIGLGASVFGGDGEVSVEQLLPDISNGRATATAKETDPFANDWQLKVYAVCAPEPAGLVTVVSGRSGTSRDKTVTARCPGTKTLLGYGYDVGDGFGEVIVNQTTPNGSTTTAADRVTVSAHEDASYGADWSLYVYALCAKPITGQRVVTATTTTDDSDLKALNAECDPGENATGGGVEITTTDPTLASEIAIDETTPLDINGGIVDAVQGVAYEEDVLANTETWSLTSYALCL